jgi:PAS domain S-box-containing protein
MPKLKPDKERQRLLRRVRKLEQRLEEAEGALHAIRAGEVDALVVAGPQGDQVYTLRGADEPYRVLVQEMQEGAVTLTAEGLILYSNAQFASLVKAPLEHVLGSRIQDFIVPSDQVAFQALLETGASGNSKGEVTLQSSDGTTAPAYLSLNSLEVDGARTVCLMVTDLTEQKRRDEIVRAERLARSILEQAVEAIVVVDPGGKIIRASQTAHSLAGGNVLLRQFDETFPLQPASLSLASLLPRVQRGEVLQGLEASLVRPDGKVSQLIVSAGALLGAGREFLGCVVTLTDVTERRRAEGRFRVLLESNLIGVMTADQEKIFEANDAFLAMIGCARQDLLEGEIRWREMTPPEYGHLDERALKEILATGRCTPYEKEYCRKDGSRVPILMGATLLEHSPLQWASFVLDLTERKQIEERLFQAQKMESIGLLAGGIAHDFNNLLTGVLGNASLALDDLPRSHPVRPRIEEVISASEKAAGLTRQLLAYAGKGQFVIQAVNLSERVRDITELIRASIPKSVRIRLELQEDLPWVAADPSQIQQLVMNLVINAGEAIGEGSGTVLIRTGTVELRRQAARKLHPAFDVAPGPYVQLEVTDDGCGMSEDIFPRIFDPFFSTKFTGRGLGLAAVHGIMRAHKGAIEVHSTPGKGSTFRVLLPPLQQPAESESPLPRLEVRGTGTILVVDDEQVVRQVAQAALERRGYRVLLAEDGKAALEMFEKHSELISLVLLDLTMPEMGGVEAFQRLKAMRPEIKVLLSSGYNEAEATSRFEGLGLAGFVQKPYTSARLAEKIRTVLAG